MKPVPLRATTIILGTIVAAHLSFGQSRNDVDDLYNYAQAHKSDLRLSTYVTVGAVESDLSDAAGRREVLSVLRSLGITKVYVETYRSGRVADAGLLQTVRDYFESNGLEVAGGIATTPGKGFGVRQEGQLGWFNFQHPKTRRDLKKVIRLTAGIFDEMIVDDFLCTADTSAMSVAARGDRTWSQYRRGLLTGLSQDLIVRSAREENPGITIIIKYPQWYDRFHMFGYDVVRQPEIFDKVWVGTETRGPATRRMGYVQPYEGFVNFRWLRSLAPDKVAGAWFDHIDCDANDFINQAYETVLAGAREIVLFNSSNLIQGHPGHHLLRRQFATLVKLAAMVRQNHARGVHAYKPPHSNAGSDYYIYDYLGMIGIPLLPVGQFPAGAEVIFLPTQASADPELMEHVEGAVAAGKTLILTAGLLRAMSDNQRLQDLAGVQLIPLVTPIKATNLIVNNEMSTFEQGLDLAAHVKPVSARVLLAASHDGDRLPVLTVHTPRTGGKVYVLNLLTFSEPDFAAIHEVLLAPKPVSWLDLPVPWFSVIRQAFMEPPGMSFKGPGRISLHRFGDDHWVFCNFNEDSAAVDLELEALVSKGQSHQFVNSVTGEKLSSSENTLRLVIGKRQVLWLQRSP